MSTNNGLHGSQLVIQSKTKETQQIRKTRGHTDTFPMTKQQITKLNLLLSKRV